MAIAPPRPQTLAPSTLTTPALAVLLLGVALVPIDMFVVNVALASIGAWKPRQPPPRSWRPSSPATASRSAVALVIGSTRCLGDRFGRRRVFLAGMAGFTLASLVGRPLGIGVLVGRRGSRRGWRRR